MCSRNLKQVSPARHPLSVRWKLVYALVAVLLFFTALEAVLRVTGLGSPPIIGSLRFGYDTGIPRFDSDGIEFEGRTFQDYPLFEADAVVFWKPIADTPFTGTDGLRLPVPDQRNKTPGVLRVAVVGDSCSFLGRELYPQRFAEMAERERSQPVQIVNASCPGYSSFQGLRRLDDVWAWEPDWLIVYFGWNDHWKSLTGRTDAELASSLRAIETASARLQRFHIYWATARILGRYEDSGGHRGNTVRVPLSDYRANLDHIAVTARQHGCRVVFVTAPTLFVEHQLPAWVDSFFHGYYEMSRDEIEAIPATHRQYNDVVRQVAEQQGEFVLDLAASWVPDESAARFRGDCIHLTEQGHEDVAKALFELWKAR